MKLRQLSFIAALLTAAAIAGSGGNPGPTAAPPLDATVPEVIDLDGLGTVEFGDTEQELARRGVLEPEAPCGPGLAGLDTVSPIFADERLVLLWASPPMRTPEGVTVGTPVNRVRAAYPDATGLSAPAGTYRFDGLLARDGDRAYLFLHDGRTVRKTIAGYAEHARRLFDEGYSPC
ncbi:hypothetical protein [Micromonospora sp. CPCC 206060]|uniref:hypothetical protein n=1 Tax=Micromonospora sp. CPCC 206060 TaxID=3122406 RepID=UPI003FA55FDE